LTLFLHIVYLAEPNNIESVVVDEEKGSVVTANRPDSITRLKRAAATAVSAAAVKARFLGDQEEYQIRRLTALVIEKLVIRKSNYGTVPTSCCVFCSSSIYDSYL
jgi:hypothetical protein